jgi:hypothetical protein
MAQDQDDDCREGEGSIIEKLKDCMGSEDSGVESRE